MKRIVFFDTEVGIGDKKIHDIGAVRDDGAVLHTKSVREFFPFAAGCEFVCGHNIIRHDLKYLESESGIKPRQKAIDTLYLSPLLFPRRPYHRLLKDDKLQVDTLNNPVNDSEKARDLFYDEVNAYLALSSDRKKIYHGLLVDTDEFSGFFDYIGTKPFFNYSIEKTIRQEYRGMICANADIGPFIRHSPRELAYALALIGCGDLYSVTPPWLVHNFPEIENIIKILCNTPCAAGCDYCREALNIDRGLRKIFGFTGFRTYNGEPLQKAAAEAAVKGKSLLAVFPTGGGKSLAFQLPAVMAGRSSRGLTVVISPLQSLMKDQVDNLADFGIEDAVTVNGTLNPIERAEAIERVLGGRASLLYISPEQLRSKTVEKLLMSRNVIRFVIDEAHCFSAWGQDFRVDYLYIADFIDRLRKEKHMKEGIPVSCFTATAKQKVITDICDYFKKKLDIDLEIFATSATRENLRYAVLFKETDDDKYNTLRSLIAQKDCPTIVYASRVKRTRKLAQKLTGDGIPAVAYNGKMEPAERIANQEAFMKNKVPVIVATTAFGMGVDKRDVGLVVHYDISDSLENYVQEAGRAGRNPDMQADCYVLFNNDDLDKHFILLNQTKLSIGEIQQVWRAVKNMTKRTPRVCCSALEIARAAGWDEFVTSEIQTRITAAIAALESAGYVKRGNNVPHVYATGIRAKDMEEAARRIRASDTFTDSQKETALRIVKSLISSRSIATAGNADAESRVDYLADILGIEKRDVIESVNLMKQDGLLDDWDDMSASLPESGSSSKAKATLERFAKLESYILSRIDDGEFSFNFRQLNEEAQGEGITGSSVKNIRIILYYLSIKNYITKNEDRERCEVSIASSLDKKRLTGMLRRRTDICRFVIERLYEKSSEMLKGADNDEKARKKDVQFSLVGLLKAYRDEPRLDIFDTPVTLRDMEDALLYLSKTDILKLEGGFLVLYNGMEIRRVVTDNRIQYKADDYRRLDEYYKQKIQQIHIVGEYANLMVKDYNAALLFVQDYFNMDYKKFIAKYFKGERADEIGRNITPQKYDRLFDKLSDKQSEIIHDSDSKYIVVAAGPGSGKTMILAHKLASLLLMEDVKSEKLLMLTFSRAAATEFKTRLKELVGGAAEFVEIKTFHSYSFDLLGKIGSLEASSDVVANATKMIEQGEVESGKITKSVLVIDEAQDMDENEFALVRALMLHNEDMRVIAVGDDDQNIYAFRGSDSKYFAALAGRYGAKKYEMTENFRSRKSIVALANAFIKPLGGRMKSAPIEAVSAAPGTVRITRHTCRDMEEAVAYDLVAAPDRGSTCVLTRTNEEALCVLAILLKFGKRARFIRSPESFKLCNILEVRAFLKEIDKKLETPKIPDELWDFAKKELNRKYAGSECLGQIRRMIKAFEDTHKAKYRTDLQEFIYESGYEDFYDDDGKVISVSTIHKAKGKEFDTVYMMIKDGQIATGISRDKKDEERRLLYVGMTRAKNNLVIHTNTGIFDAYRSDGIVHARDEKNYGEPSEIILQTTHRDVFLDFFIGKEKIICGLRSGDPLYAEENYLTARANGRTYRVAKFSKSFAEKLDKFKSAGYLPTKAAVGFIVAWKKEKEEREIPILLADITLTKNKSTRVG